MSASRIIQLKIIARNLDMDFREKDEWGLLNILKGFHLFRQGGRKKITNILCVDRGLEDFKVHIFDYRYVISTGKSSRRFKQTVFFVQSKELALPEFWMKPEHFFHKLGNYLGFDDINFEERPEFSKQYYLKGKDEALIRHAFHDEVLHHFTIEKNWYLEGVGYFFILYKKDKLFTPSETSFFFKNGMKLFQRFLDSKKKTE